MRVLVVFGSKMGGTAGIAGTIAETLTHEGLWATLAPADDAPGPEDFQAAIVGGGIYASRWHKATRRYVKRHTKALRARPVWLFSSGPLDDSASTGETSPSKQVEKLMDRIGARGHVTFGGRMPADAKGFPASAMAKKNAGDWRDMNQVRAWARGISAELQAAKQPV